MSHYFCYLIHIFKLLYYESIAAYVLLQYMYVSGTVLSKEDKEVQRQKELKMMKVKYGLKVSFYVLYKLFW